MGRVYVLKARQELVKKMLYVLRREVLRRHNELVEVRVHVLEHEIQVPERGNVVWRDDILQVDDAGMSSQPPENVHLPVYSLGVHILIERPLDPLDPNEGTSPSATAVAMRRPNVHRLRHLSIGSVAEDTDEIVPSTHPPGRERVGRGGSEGVGEATVLGGGDGGGGGSSGTASGGRELLRLRLRRWHGLGCGRKYCGASDFPVRERRGYLEPPLPLRWTERVRVREFLRLGGPRVAVAVPEHCRRGCNSGGGGCDKLSVGRGRRFGVDVRVPGNAPSDPFAGGASLVSRRVE
mmetsp:Transcript_24351/g.48467  ORF Transcript_24351/g.48467 Transcript_24351/m.48467 type:complete len:293 (+) Transcript_24351:989-1867(+)